MRTLKDLVEELNAQYVSEDTYGVFRIGKSEDTHYFSFNEVDFAILDEKTKKYYITSGFGRVDSKLQKIIIDYLGNADPSDWFEEKKYNIEVAQDLDHNGNVLNHILFSKDEGKDDYRYKLLFAPRESYRSALQDNQCQFTEEEIEKIKKTLPANMAKIVEMGKVEVKDD